MNIYKKLQRGNTQTGFTLIEVVIYIALFSIIIGGALVTVFQIVQSSTTLGGKVVLQEEANFLLRKINWALNGATSVPVFASSSTLTITNSSGNLIFDLNDGYMRLDGNNLNSQNVTVSDLEFTHASISAPVKTTFKLKVNETKEEGTFETTRYLRK